MLINLKTLKVSIIDNTRGGSSWKDKETYTYNEVRLPVSQIIYTGTSGTNKTGETRWTYDTNWNISSKKSALYNVTTFIGQAYPALFTKTFKSYVQYRLPLDDQAF